MVSSCWFSWLITRPNGNAISASSSVGQRVERVERGGPHGAAVGRATASGTAAAGRPGWRGSARRRRRGLRRSAATCRAGAGRRRAAATAPPADRCAPGPTPAGSSAGRTGGAARRRRNRPARSVRCAGPVEIAGQRVRGRSRRRPAPTAAPRRAMPCSITWSAKSSAGQRPSSTFCTNRCIDVGELRGRPFGGERPRSGWPPRRAAGRPDRPGPRCPTRWRPVRRPRRPGRRRPGRRAASPA